jgi:probable HAF family extracellular repeat protein
LKPLLFTIQSIATILTLMMVLLGQYQSSLAAQFIPIPSLDDQTYSAAATGVSQDGHVVVGWSESDEGVRAFRWTSADGIQSLGAGFMPGLMEPVSQATAISANSEVIVGWTHYFDEGSYSARKMAFFWSIEGGFEIVPTSSSGNNFIPRAVSADGSVIVGDVETSAYDSFAVIFHWNHHVETILGGTSWHKVQAIGVSHDGQWIAGSGVYSLYPNYYYPRASFLYNEDSRFQFIGQLSGDTFLRATALSADGRLIAGKNGASSPSIFRWTESTGIVDIGTLSGTSDPEILAVNETGSIMVGRAGAVDNWSALIWDEANGFQYLSDYVTQAFGLDLQGWRLTRADAITQYAIVGQGINPDGIEKAWLIQIRRFGDSDTDGDVDGADLSEYTANHMFNTIESFVYEFGR